MNKQEYMSILASEAKEPPYLYAAFSGRVIGIVKGVGSDEYKLAELSVLIDAFEEVQEMMLIVLGRKADESQRKRMESTYS